MASKNIDIIITAKDEASKSLKSISKTASDISKDMRNVGLGMSAVGVAATAAAKTFVDAAVEMENSFTGLNTVARAFEVDAEMATNAAKTLADDGLMSVKDSAEGLKNLLATGFSLPESIKLMEGLKDSAAFNRQGMLDFGQAVVGATQGLKNQNSIMVDNAGVTKNLSVILREAGYSQGDLGKVTSDAAVRQALYNGILQETSIFQGDAVRASQTLGGQMSQLNTQMFMLKATLGDALAPALTILIQQITPIVQKFAEFAANNPMVIAAITALLVVLLPLGTSLLLVSAAITAITTTLPILTALFVAITGPIGLTVIALGVLAAGIIYATTHFEQMRDIVSNVWASITATTQSKVNTILALVTGGFKGVLMQVTTNMLASSDVVKNTTDAIIQTFTSAMNLFVSIAKSKMQEAYGFIESIGSRIRGVFDSIRDAINGAISAMSELAGKAGSFVGGALGFQHGGIIPGGAGDAVPAVLHGGERVISRTGTDVNTGGSGGGTTVNLIIEGDVNSMDMVDNIVNAVKSALDRDTELATLGVGV